MKATARLGILVVAGCLIPIPGCRSLGNAPKSKPVDTHSSISLLRTLRAVLDAVEAAPPDDYAFAGYGLDLSPLVGTTRQVISSTLGEPRECTDRDDEGLICRAAGDWNYYFAHVPANMRGGGLILALRFSRDDRCTEALWIRTQ